MFLGFLVNQNVVVSQNRVILIFSSIVINQIIGIVGSINVF